MQPFNAIIKILIIIFLIVPFMIGSLIWAAISSVAIWGIQKIDEKTNAKVSITPAIISLVFAILLLAGSIGGSVLISKV